MDGVSRLIAWNRARIEYQIAVDQKCSGSILKSKWRKAQASFAVSVGINELDADEQELEFCQYMREWHDDILPPFIVGYNKLFEG